MNEPQPQRSEPSGYTPPFNENYDPLLDSSEPLADTSWYSDAGEPPPTTDDKPQFDERGCEIFDVPGCLHQQPKAAPRGDQEWFYVYEPGDRWHVYFSSIEAGGVIVGTEGQAKSICESHNAALAAEQKHHDLNLAVWEKDNADLRQQLLSAQAAIENVKNARTGNENFRTVEALEYVDLSALHQHDAEVRKPLVEALEAQAKLTAYYNGKGKDYPNWQTYLCQEAADALAKVKEDK